MQRLSQLLSVLMIGLLAALLTGCGSSDGPSLFTEDETEPTEDTDEINYEGDVELFGYQVEGTQCVKQLHGGCVPYDYRDYAANKFGLPFLYPQDWNVTGASEFDVMLRPRELSSDEDPTTLLGYRGVVDPRYDVLKETLTDAGKGEIGPYDVTWEIYEGTWNEQTVTSEWVWLTYDDTRLDPNYIFVLFTEPENFDADQNTLQGVVSSIWDQFLWEDF